MDKNRSRWATLPTTPFLGSNLPPQPGERPSLNNGALPLRMGSRLVPACCWRRPWGRPCGGGAGSIPHPPWSGASPLPLPGTAIPRVGCSAMLPHGKPVGSGLLFALFSGPDLERRLGDRQVGVTRAQQATASRSVGIVLCWELWDLDLFFFAIKDLSWEGGLNKSVLLHSQSGLRLHLLCYETPCIIL